ncbi:hypothetical protein IYQ_23320 [Aeromonas salmonicida subsp. salmonicida 01-B526]|uniref:Uncharacterized protein n=1 Tax=Aeromonas salmonicida subsp. salmonicida 01-B526 TaxID=1076135 RepID=A0ABN0DTP3_AERSS|nr:hypothetical protein IYQ_23320 [Aeromonas salmonicida subsp. salmonicida 01-B526]
MVIVLVFLLMAYNKQKHLTMKYIKDMGILMAQLMKPRLIGLKKLRSIEDLILF